MGVKKSLLMFLMLALFLGSLLAACSGGEDASSETNSDTGSDSEENVSSGEVIELDFWTFWGSETRRPIIEKIIEDFNNSQDGIQVKHTFLPWGDIWTKSLASIAAGNPPDVLINENNAVRQRAERNQVTNLAEFVEPGFSDNYYPELWNGVVHEGEPYAVPFNTDTRVLFYNKDIFEEVGLDPEQPPTTWDELKEYAMKMDIKNGNTYDRIGFLPRYGAGADLYMLNATGHGMWDFETGEPVINVPKAVEALEWVKEYEDHYGLTVINAFQAEFGNQQSNPFLNGKVGMIVNNSTHYAEIEAYASDLNFGVVPLPEFGAGNGHASWGGGFVAEVPFGAEHPEASFEFIKYLTGPEAQEYWAIMNFENVANIEGANNAAVNPELNEDGQLVYGAAVDNMDHTILTPMPLEAPDFMSLVNPELDRIFLGDKTPQEALDDAQAAVERLVEDNK
ncbi:ABC transporter substrate-binding protein [Halalkalibacter kiskunsagensis]|uniref:ABC transporter substrate-binding protein n=1 Tax=Halalkalibacter kiskunsagensis TaxID=1548599 RepID=A0ABV6KGB9_9BACI